MPAYWVARSKINDPVEYKKYTDLVPDIIAKPAATIPSSDRRRLLRASSMPKGTVAAVSTSTRTRPSAVGRPSPGHDKMIDGKTPMRFRQSSRLRTKSNGNRINSSSATQ